jgi:hypothetical protein
MVIKFLKKIFQKQLNIKTTFIVQKKIFFSFSLVFVKYFLRNNGNFRDTSILDKTIVEQKVINSTKILRSIRTLNSIYSELYEYNRDFCSLYLLLIWLMFANSYKYCDLFLLFSQI